jgi:SAM-dependent methyltransferase
MKTETVEKLIQLNNDFYTNNSESFSATRQGAWNGWSVTSNLLQLPNKPITVLDIACGNMRYYDFLKQNYSADFEYLGVDACLPLTKPSLQFLELNIIKDYNQLPKNFSDLSVCFGFFHHIPTINLRAKILQAIVDSCKTNGYIVISFWQFMKDERIANKVIPALRPIISSSNTLEHTTNLEQVTDLGRTADLEQGDYILDWQNNPKSLRYCHNFTDEEVDQLVACLNRVKIVDRFYADGKSNNLNCYVVLEKL